MGNTATNNERGVAMFFSIFALLLLTAIGAALIFMASTETSVNSNYRQEQVASFAAKAGIEEARARMMASDPNSINNGTPLPTLAPTIGNQSIVYITNPGSGAAVQPWNSGDTYADLELCHDGYSSLYASLNITVVAPDVRCAATTLPAGAYTSYTSTLPFNTTAEALPYKWVRIAPKVNNSVSYLNTSLATIPYSVNGGSGTSTTICWNGAEEQPLTAATCSAMVTATNAPMTNVYLITAMGVSSSSSNAARKVVQGEVALQPTAPFPYGMFATSNACPAISFSGNPPSTNSYTTANGGTYGGANDTTSSWGGDIGSNGGVDIQNGNVGGIVGVLPTACAPSKPFNIGAQGTSLGPNCSTPSSTCVACSGPTGPYCLAGTETDLTQPYKFAVPPAPNPIPPNKTYNPPSCGGKGKSGSCMTPGTYGNISLTGALTLAPGIYNINSLSETGQGTITVSPPGAVVLNIGGCGDATCSTANALANPLNIAGQGAVQIADDGIPNDFLINYAGSGTISIAGKGNATAMLNAPLAAITQQGNSQWFGSILASTVHLGGNAFFHFDRASALAPNNNGYYTLISYREVPY